jgi:hypothetical protein
VLRILGPKREEVKGGRRKQRNEELHNFYSSPSMIRMNESRMMLAGYVARIGRRGMHIGYCWKARRKETTRKTKT